MKTFLSLFFLISSQTVTTLDAQNCKPASCTKSGSPVVRFPFRLTGHQPQSCGYPGYDLSCNNMNQLILNLPSSGEYIVSQIDYVLQSIYIVPDFCNMSTINVPVNLSKSPFIAPDTRDYIFFNCSSGGASNILYPLEQVDCISKANATIVAIPAFFYFQYNIQSTVPPDCNNISTIGFPTQRGAIFLQQDFQLSWGPPFCGRCEAQAGTCEFKNDGTLEVQCSKSPRPGLSTAAKYGIIFGVGIPGFLCLLCLLSYVGNRIKLYTDLRRNQQTMTTTTVAQRPVFFTMGLDKPTIESYPMIVLGESKRLPKPNDSTCAICLSEYQPKDTLRTVPECLHYFHANCIDAWLMLNATCPVCRNSPQGSSEAHTPSSSISSRTSLFSS